MSRSLPRWAAVLAAVVPALALAALGCSHPAMLTPESAPWWRDLHVIGLVLFPLLALGPWVAVHGRSRVVEAVVIVLGLVYAGFYTALDALAGIGGGASTMAMGPGPWVAALFGAADMVTTPAVYAYLAATLVGAVVVVVSTAGHVRLLAVVGGVIAVVGAWSFLTSHIYYPVGVLTMVVLAVGQGLLAWTRWSVRRPRERAAHAVAAG